MGQFMEMCHTKLLPQLVAWHSETITSVCDPPRHSSSILEEGEIVVVFPNARGIDIYTGIDMMRTPSIIAREIGERTFATVSLGVLW